MTDPFNFPECTSYPALAPFVTDPNRRIAGHYFAQEPFAPTAPLVPPKPAALQRVKDTTKRTVTAFDQEEAATLRRKPKTSIPKPTPSRATRR